MLKLLKYELRSRIVFLGGSCVILALINILLLLDSSIFKLVKFSEGWNIGFSMLAGFAAMVVVLVGTISRLEKDLYSEIGYLTFTLPRSGYSILGAKLLASFIEITVFIIINFVFFILQMTPDSDLKLSDISIILKETVNHFQLIIFMLFVMILSLISFILMVYFSLVSVRSFSKKRKLGKAASFCVFVGICIVLGLLDTFLVKTFPQTINLDILGSLNVLEFSGPGWNIGASSELPLNIASSIINLVLPVGLFLSTGYLMEKRVDI